MNFKNIGAIKRRTPALRDSASADPRMAHGNTAAMLSTLELRRIVAAMVD